MLIHDKLDTRAFSLSLALYALYFNVPPDPCGPTAACLWLSSGTQLPRLATPGAVRHTCFLLPCLAVTSAITWITFPFPFRDHVPHASAFSYKPFWHWQGATRLGAAQNHSCKSSLRRRQIIDVVVDGEFRHAAIESCKTLEGSSTGRRDHSAELQRRVQFQKQLVTWDRSCDFTGCAVLRGGVILACLFLDD
jgi:hypothetical protein